MSCKCHDCQEQYTVDLMLPDELWEKIKPAHSLPGAGLLCPSCIGQRLEELGTGKYSYYKLTGEN